MTDTPDGPHLAPLGGVTTVFHAYDNVPSLAGEPATCRHSLCIAYYGWPEDLAAMLAGVVAAPDARGQVELLLVPVGQASSPSLEVLGPHPGDLAGPPAVLVVEGGVGHAEALNVAARRARGEFVHFAEPSLHLTWDALEAAAVVLADPAVGACGPFGLVTDDWREFRPAAGGERVIALEYLQSLRRGDLDRVGEMDRGFRFYRNLDIDFSRQVAAAGFDLRVSPVAIERGPHRVWEATPADERERLSRRNFNRLLDRWVRVGGPGS